MRAVRPTIENKLDKDCSQRTRTRVFDSPRVKTSRREVEAMEFGFFVPIHTHTHTPLCGYVLNMNMNLFNHNNNSTDNYDIVQLNSCGC